MSIESRYEPENKPAVDELDTLDDLFEEVTTARKAKQAAQQASRRRHDSTLAGKPRSPEAREEPLDPWTPHAGIAMWQVPQCPVHGDRPAEFQSWFLVRTRGRGVGLAFSIARVEEEPAGIRLFSHVVKRQVACCAECLPLNLPHASLEEFASLAAFGPDWDQPSEPEAGITPNELLEELERNLI